MRFIQLLLALLLNSYFVTTGFTQLTCFSSANDNVFEGIGNSRCVTKGDFDNDGDLDVVMGNYTGTPNPTISRLYFINNVGSASFSAPVALSSGSQPLDVQSADLDNDGNLDLVVVNFNLTRMAVMLGNGDGTFQAPVGYTSDFGPNKITLEDFDGDGFIDVAISTNANTVNVFLNDNGSPGTFLAFTSFTMNGGSNPSGIYSADLDNDGNIDIVTANSGTGNASVLIGDGTGSFSAPTDYLTGVGCSSVVLGDMNNDTNLDIITSNEDVDEISILLNDGTGAFLPTTNYATGSGPIALMVDDFDNNLNLDVVTVNTQDNTLSILTGNGDGTVQPQNIVGAINSPRNLITGDFNNDTFSDIIISCLIGQVMPVYLGDGTASFNSGGNSFGVGNAPVALYSADFNTDGFIDFVAVNSIDNNATVHNGDGSGTSFTLNSTLITGTDPSSVIGADLDNNGFEDLIVANYADNNVSVFMNTAGTFGVSTSFNANATPIELRSGDINFDGNPDVIVLNENNEFSVLIGNGAGGFAAPVSYATGNTPLGIDVADINGDNFDDVVVANSADDNISIYTNDGTGLFGVPANRSAGNGPNSVTFGDLGSDGAPEIVTTNQLGNNITVHTNNGTGLFGFFSTNYTSNDTGPLSAVIDDFDGDGNNDVAVANLVSIASTGNVAIFVGDGANALTFDQSYSVGMDPREVITDDFNNDGLPDLATVNLVSETVTVLLNTGGSPTITALGSTTLCNGGSVVLQSTPASNYLWSNGETTQSITVSSAGTYDVSTSSGIGGWCSSLSNQITVTVDAGPVLSFTGDTDICVGESTTLTVSGATTYTWSNSLGTGDTKTVSPGSTTTYTVVGDDGSACTGEVDITVTVNPLPDATFSGLSAQYCETTSAATLIPVIAGGTFSGPGISSDQFDPASAGVGTHVIQYSITDANSCSNSSTQSVDVLSSVIDSDFTGYSLEYCIDEASSTLVPNQSGGTFSGTGVTGNVFNPSVAGIGVHAITHEITSGGCTGSTTYSVEVFDLPDATFTGLNASYCLNDGSSALTPAQAGGTFSGPGISGNDFDPATAGVGVHSITYSITDGNGCVNSSNQTVEVFSLPDASFSGLNLTYCVDAGTSLISPTQGGGTLSGPGISGSSFDPSIAGVGTHTITYSLINGNGCVNTSSQIVNVVPLPDATFTGLNATYCANGASATLTPTQSGGSFSGTGITGNVFDPLAAGVGTYTITYSITDGNGCVNSSNQTVEVFPLPDADFTGLAADYCVDAGVVTLTPNQSGGTFGGPGTVGSDFDPNIAGVGIHSITYTITDGNGCSNSSAQSVEVFALPDASFTGLDPNYCINASVSTLTPALAGGVFSGVGISGDDFDPAAAGVGTHILNYSITDGNGCVNSSNQTVVVDDQFPDATFTGLDSEYCLNDGIVSPIPALGGGSFSGPGISSNDFDPAAAGVGVHSIDYTVTDINACTSSSSQSVEVLGLPDASFSGLNPTYCIDAATVTLAPTQTGGSFSGAGVTGNDFDPAIAGIGIHTITYSLTNGNACTNTTNQTVEVVALPDASFAGLNATYCADAATVLLTATQSGGTFSGPGMTGSDFDPNAAGIGVHTITYSIVDGNGCLNTSTQSVEVLSAPIAGFTGLAATYCLNEASVPLTPSQAGGTFGGPGITGSDFDPSAAGVGVHTVTYNITDGSGCSNTSSQVVEVYDLPDATFTGLALVYCIDGGSVSLTPSQTGGTFNGPGITGNTFDPNAAGVGSHTITYSLTNGNGCSSTTSQIVDVDDQLPDAAFSGLATVYCEDIPAVTLVPNQSGGTFSGPGITGNSFDPIVAGVGNHMITYSITGLNTCINSTSQTVEVIDSVDPNFSGLAIEYCLNDASSTLIPVETGGTFSGPGTVLNSNVFNPSLAGVGSHTITYTQTNSNGCISSSSQVVEVYDVLDASFTGLDLTYCIEGDEVTLIPAVSGGSFTGNTSADLFDPALATLGVNTITYTITTAQGCSSTTSQTTEVYDLPTSTFVRNGLTLTADASGPDISFEWYSCSGDSVIPGENNQILEVTENGSYALIISNSGCTDTSECEVINDVSLSSEKKSSVVIYPNPNNGMFTIDLEIDSEIKVYDAIGKLIHSKTLKVGANVLDLRNIVETGVYIIEISDKTGNKSIHNLVIRQ